MEVSIIAIRSDGFVSTVLRYLFVIPAAGAVYNTVVNQVTIIIHLLSEGDVNMSRMSTARAHRVRLQLAGADNLVQLLLIQHHNLFARFDVLCGADFFSVLSMIFSSLLCYFFVTCIRYHMNITKATHTALFFILGSSPLPAPS